MQRGQVALLGVREGRESGRRTKVTRSPCRCVRRKGIETAALCTTGLHGKWTGSVGSQRVAALSCV